MESSRDEDTPECLHWTTQLPSSNPSEQSLRPSHSCFGEMHRVDPGQRTDGGTHGDAEVRTGDAAVAAKTASGMRNES